MWQFFRSALFLVFSGLITYGQIAQHPVGTPDRPATGSGPSFSNLDDLIHLGDLIEIDVIGSTEFDWRGELTPEGFLTGLRFTNDPVYALCRDSDEVAKAVHAAYSKFLNNLEVRVSILDRSKRPLAVLLGAVRLPQRFKLLKEVSLREVIVMSGGFTENTSGDIQILRQPSAACTGFSAVDNAPAEGIRKAETGLLTVGIDDILSGEPEFNPDIFYGDVVTVTQALPVYVIGDVAKPGSLPFSKDLTAKRAIDAAGGIAGDSDRVEVRVFRRNPSGTTIIEVKPGSVKKALVPEFRLREYDIVEVFGGSGKRLEYPPVLRDPVPEAKPVNSLPIRIVN